MSSFIKSTPEAVQNNNKLHTTFKILRNTYLPARILNCLLLRSISLILWCSFKHIKKHRFPHPNLEDTCAITAPVAVVRCGPYCGEMFIEQR